MGHFQYTLRGQIPLPSGESLWLYILCVACATRPIMGNHERHPQKPKLKSGQVAFVTPAPLTQITKKKKHNTMRNVKVKVKVSHTRLPSVGFGSWYRFLAVSLQVTWIINPAVGCHYIPPGLQLPSQRLRGLLLISLLGEQRHDGREQFA